MRKTTTSLALCFALTAAHAAQEQDNATAPPATPARAADISTSLGGWGDNTFVRSLLAGPRSASDAPQAAESEQSSAAASTASRIVRAGEDLIMQALSLVGVRYRWGSADPAHGLDCSGLVKLVFGQAAGITLPHNAYSISLQGEKVAMDDLKPGDLLFFNTLRRAFSHVGIYIGDNRFVHAGSSSKQVEVVEFDQYWVKRFNGARRLVSPDKQP